MSEETLQIAVSSERTITAIRTPPEAPSNGWLFVYAPGAGSNVHDRFGAYACRHLAGLGFTTVRFQFPYMEAGKRRPDVPGVLEATWRAVIDATRADGLRLAVGGRSMGGRIASQVVAKGVAADALALLAYPLRPPRSPSQVRDAHFPAIKAPTLFCSGTRDSFAAPDELRLAASKVPHSKVHLMEGADHGFSVLKSSSRTREAVWEEAAAAVVELLNSP